MTKATKKPLCVSLLAMALFMMPVASAATWHAELTVESVQALGTSSTSGRLTALLQEIVLPADQAGEPAFTLQAETLHLETDHTDAAVGPPVEINHDPRTLERDYRDVTVVGVEHRDQYRFVLVPLGDGVTVLAADATCVSLRASESEQVSRDTHVDAERARLTASASSALAWRGCAAGEVTLRGDFVLQLWNWDSELTTSAGERQYLASGRQSMAPDSSGLAPPVGSADEQFLFAYNATLTTPLTGNYRLYLESPTVEAAGFQLESATGRLSGPTQLDLEDEDVIVHGDASLRITGRGTGTAFSVAMQGDVQRLAIDGVAVTLVTTIPAADASITWLGAAALLAALVVWVVARWNRPLRAYRHNAHVDGRRFTLTAATRRQRRGAGHWLLAYAAAKRGHHGLSHWHARRALANFPGLPEARAMRGFASHRLGRSDEALRDLSVAHEQLQDHHARADVCVAAAEASMRGDREAAVTWLRRGFEDDPLFVAQVLQGGRFEALRDHAWIQTVCMRGALVAR